MTFTTSRPCGGGGRGEANSINTYYKFAPSTLRTRTRTYPGSIAADVLGPGPPQTSPDQVGLLWFLQHCILLYAVSVRGANPWWDHMVQAATNWS